VPRDGKLGLEFQAHGISVVSTMLVDRQAWHFTVSVTMRAQVDQGCEAQVDQYGIVRRHVVVRFIARDGYLFKIRMTIS
jgi:hypothetical protein